MAPSIAAQVSPREMRVPGRGRQGGTIATPAGAGVAIGIELLAVQPPIRKTLPPQSGQMPWVAGLPFFMVIFSAFWITTFFLSLTQ
jgi:hypothetical protein